MQLDSGMAAEPLRDRTLGKGFRDTGNQIRERWLIKTPKADQRKFEAESQDLPTLNM